MNLTDGVGIPRSQGCSRSIGFGAKIHERLAAGEICFVGIFTRMVQPERVSDFMTDDCFKR